MSQRVNRWLFLSAALTCGAAVLIISALSKTTQFQMLEDLSRDWRFQLRGTQSIDAPITIVAVDEDSLHAEELSEPLVFWGPHHAQVFQTLHQLGATAIGFDFLQYISLADYADPNPDQEWAAVIATIPELVLVFKRQDTGTGQVQEVLPAPQLNMALALGGGQLGYDSTEADPDQVIRRQPLMDTDGALSFALAVATVATGEEPKLEPGVIRLGARRIPVDDHVRVLINYIGPPGSYPTVSYRQLLREPDQVADKIRGRVCLIGATAYELQDYHATPFSRGGSGSVANLMSGIEVHANTVRTLLSGQYLRRSDERQQQRWTIAAAVVAALFCCLPKVYQVPFSLLALIALWSGVCQLAFERYAWQLPWLPIVSVMVVNDFFMVLLRLRRERGARQFIEGMFGRYVSPAALRHLLTDPEAVTYGGKRRVVTILFSDIRGFTTMSEQLEPEQVTSVLNEYLTAMVEVIFEHGGTVDKFIGDAIMVEYNWPVEQRDHADRAVRTAVAMYRRVLELRDRWQAEAERPFDIGIGVHTGPVVIGNMGSPDRMELTAIGDTVNVASRLEGMNKELHTNILISEETQAMLTDEFALEPRDAIAIRGRSAKMKVYAVAPQ